MFEYPRFFAAVKFLDFLSLSPLIRSISSLDYFQGSIVQRCVIFIDKNW